MLVEAEVPSCFPVQSERCQAPGTQFEDASRMTSEKRRNQVKETPPGTRQPLLPEIFRSLSLDTKPRNVECERHLRYMASNMGVHIAMTAKKSGKDVNVL